MKYRKIIKIMVNTSYRYFVNYNKVDCYERIVLKTINICDS